MVALCVVPDNWENCMDAGFAERDRPFCELGITLYHGTMGDKKNVFAINTHNAIHTRQVIKHF